MSRYVRIIHVAPCSHFSASIHLSRTLCVLTSLHDENIFKPPRGLKIRGGLIHKIYSFVFFSIFLHILTWASKEFRRGNTRSPSKSFRISTDQPTSEIEQTFGDDRLVQTDLNSARQIGYKEDFLSTDQKCSTMRDLVEFHLMISYHGRFGVEY